jgi:hypothetical protein
MTARRLTAFLATGTLVLAACGGSSPADEATPVADQSIAADPAVEQAPADTIDIGATAPDAPVVAATDAPASGASSSGAPATDAPDPAVVVPAALDFTAPLITGGEIELGALAGRPVLLWFWAPW